MDSSNYNSTTTSAKPYTTHNSTPSPFHTSPQTIPGTGPGTGTATGGSGTSPHSSINQQPSPLVPAYLTRYPSNTPTGTGGLLDQYGPSPPSNTGRRPTLTSSISTSNYSDTLDMYHNGAGGRSDSFSHAQTQNWPALPPTSLGGAGVEKDRGWNNDNRYPSSSSSSSKARYNNQQQQQITHPPPHGSNSNNNNNNGSSNKIFPSSGPTAKRGSKACVACRRGKNRCEFDPTGSESSCRRCLLNGTQCVFEKPSEKGTGTRNRNGSINQSQPQNQNQNQGHYQSSEGMGHGNDTEREKINNLERTVKSLTQSQDQIQNVLQQILQLLPNQNSNQGSLPTPSTSSLPNFGEHHHPTAIATSSIFPSSVSPPSIFNQNQGNGHDNASVRQEDIILQAFTASGNGNRLQSPQNTASGRSLSMSTSGNQLPTPGKRDFPKLPGFAPPAHQFGTYGVIPLPSAPPSPSRSRHSSRSSSSHSATSSSALPRETLTAPIQALQALANAADQIAKTSPENQLEAEEEDTKDILTNVDQVEGDEDGERGRSRKRKRVLIDPNLDLKSMSMSLRVKKKKRPDPTPRNPFPDVVTKGLVSEEEARELWDIFFRGCHYFVPLWDKSYDTYETFIARTPFSTDALLAVAAKIRAGNGPLGQTFQRCLEEAQGIARSTLFGPIVRKEAVMAMLILSVWSQNGWLPCGHALRMGLDMNLHRALDRLANKDEARSEVDERDLVVSARIWLNCYMHEHLVSLGTGKPLLLRDDSSVKGARELLSHPMASETDIRLVAGVELVNLRIRILEHLTPLHGKIDSATISFVKRMLSDLNSWYKEWYAMHRKRYDDEDVLVKLLETELCYAQLWTVCVALRGVQWDKLAPDQRELAFQAKDASFRCLEIFLKHDNFRKHLKYATHDQLVSVAFAAVFLLKIAMLYPTAVPLPFLISQVSQLAHLLSAECFAERYALTLRLMLSNFRRKTGAMSTMPGTPRLSISAGQNHQGQTLPYHPSNNNNNHLNAIGDLDGGLQSLLSLPSFDGLDTTNNGNNEMFGGVTDQMWDMTGLEGFNWPTEFSPSALPVWLQDGNVTDLGLPADGSDSLFLPPELANLFLPTAGNQTFDQYVLPDSGDVGAEAW
ncbi:hypothetical protein I302_102440 [Kwoniella bestiolae CBS 10118]|uniref:Zn(2)-C6 fungal-type domain-containing protein n=1 Tax=Kwoniella bestiolae CBS 10118 TaxID=1296100 RepID=A0A1B9GEV8_9TREE|nr:hypothetical protein I302_01131 [Kwoniella bestiolae CBS 10118]OCF29622.1 hypothetical protein I302_01131 [Kwoniella bestiolae CBS 10118]